jgi:hypothetical protein
MFLFITHIELSSSFKGNSSDESLIHDSSDDSSDDEKPWAKEMRKNYRLLKKNEREREQENGDEEENSATKNELELDESNEPDILDENDMCLEIGGLEEKKQNK